MDGHIAKSPGLSTSWFGKAVKLVKNASDDTIKAKVPCRLSSLVDNNTLCPYRVKRERKPKPKYSIQFLNF